MMKKKLKWDCCCKSYINNIYYIALDEIIYNNSGAFKYYKYTMFDDSLSL